LDGALDELDTLPLKNESYVSAWSEYDMESSTKGVLETLKSHIVQFQFPVKNKPDSADLA